MGAHSNRLTEAILMSTHSIGFYEDLTKIIFELSSNIIKYAPYFFCWSSGFVFNITAASLHSYTNGLHDLAEPSTKSCLNPDDIIEKYKEALMYYSKVGII